VSSARILTIMGSGETAPTMIKLHRQVFEHLGPGTHRAVFLDTPFGFQENAGELCQRTVEYFRQSVGHDMAVAGLPRLTGMDTVQAESALAELRRAELLFAGPGSPTYALRQWAGTPVASILRDRLARAGAVTFSSAAALTLGVVTVPVYEIYKSGSDPFWLDGLDVLSAIDLPVVVIPHYDNTEGGHHDTRFCYLGERRLAMLERELRDDVFVLGVDEHTGVLVDLEAETAMVWGRGGMTLRRQGRSVVIPAGETIPLEVLRRAGERPSGSGAGVAPSDAAPLVQPADGARSATAGEGAPAASLAEETAACERTFEAALGAGDATAAAGAALALEQAIVDWSHDMLQSDEADRARAALRAMIVRLGEAAVAGLADPRQAVAPVVEAALAVRRAVRSEKRFDLSDLVRDGLADAGIEVRDTPDGAVWELK
jgi:cyanophycinase-like exopeptidase